MVGIVLVSHGSMASGLLSALEMIAGEQDGVVSVQFPLDMTPETLRNITAKAVDSVDGGVGVLLLVDLLGGTPAFIATEQIKLRDDIVVITGANLPMLLDVCTQREGATLTELRQVALDTGRTGVVDVGECLAMPVARGLRNAGCG